MHDLIGNEVTLGTKVTRNIGDDPGTVLEIYKTGEKNGYRPPFDNSEACSVQWPDGKIEDEILSVDILVAVGRT